MPLSLLAIAGLPLFTAVALTHARMEEVRALETHWIAIDNASIALGRSDVALHRKLQQSRKRLSRADSQHHAWHACALVLATALKCQPLDRLWETWIRTQHAAVFAQAQNEWTTGRRAAVSAGKQMGVSVHVERSLAPPLKPLRCAQCGLPLGWTFAADPKAFVNTRFRERFLQNLVEWQQGSANYTITEGPFGR